MALTPVDVLHTQFKTVLKGYNKGQVDQFMHSVTEALEETHRDRMNMQREIDQLQEEVGRARRIESTMTDALVLAQRTADETKASAHKQAELIIQAAELERVKLIAEAQKDSEKYRTEITLLQATRDRFESELRSMLAGYLDWLDKRCCSEEVHSEVA